MSGSTVEVKETMARFTIDVIASCAFGINGNSLKYPDEEFGRRIRTIFDFTLQKGLVSVMAFFAPYLNKIFRLNFMDDKTNNYVRRSVWNTVEYRWEKKKFLTYNFNSGVLKTLCVQKLSSPTIYTLTVPPSSFIKKVLKPTGTTIFDKPLPSNVEVNNVSIFMAYFVGRHRVLLASEDY